MNPCRNGHDRDVVGRDASGQCRGCRSEQSRRRRSGMCRNGLHPRPDVGRCDECLSAKRRRYRERIKQEETMVLQMAREIGRRRWDE